jgi:hypothetical protein
MSSQFHRSHIHPEAVMREVIVVFGLVMLGVLSSLAVSWRVTGLPGSNPGMPEQANPVAQEQPVEQLLADVPPPDDRGTPGQRS